MTLIRYPFLAIVFAVVALFLLASVPAAEASESPGFTHVDDSTDCIADSSDRAPGDALPAENWRLPEAPGGVPAKVTTCTWANDNAKETLSGGAASLASAGIRGPTAA